MVVGSPISPFVNPTQIVIASDPSGLTAYVLDPGNFNVYPINLTDNSLQGAVTGSNTPVAIAVSPNGAYLYISQQSNNNVQQYNIAGNTNRLTPAPGATVTYSQFTTFTPGSLVISPDGNTLYVGNVGGTPYAIGAVDISMPGTPVSQATFLDLTATGASPYAMAITPDGKTLYGTLGGAANDTLAVNITSPLAPTLTATIPVGFTPLGLAITPMNLLPPSSVSGCKTQNVFLLQTDYINNITWTAPTTGSPVAYNIYRDATLTELVATVPASGTLQYYDHGRNPSVIYSYYITAVDGSGNQSTAASVTVTSPC
jgi:DNA-binding beta-propeller fold protein YncE